MRFEIFRHFLRHQPLHAQNKPCHILIAGAYCHVAHGYLNCSRLACTPLGAKLLTFLFEFLQKQIPVFDLCLLFNRQNPDRHEEIFVSLCLDLGKQLFFFIFTKCSICIFSGSYMFRAV